MHSEKVGAFRANRTEKVGAFRANKTQNQRTNGPVNAHLRPEIYTCTNKLVRLEWYNACI